MSFLARTWWSVTLFAELQRERFTVCRAARMEGRNENCFAATAADGSGTIEIAPAAYQRMLSNHLERHARRTSVRFNRPLLRARDRLERARRRQERLSERVREARDRCPADADGAILGAWALLALSVTIAIPLSWGFIQEFEWPLLFSVVACVGLSLIDAAVAHLAGRLWAVLDLDEPDTAFALTARQRTNRKVMLGLALGVALSLTVSFAVFRSGNGGSVWLWLAVGLAALLIAAWSGFVGYPVSRVRVLRRLERRLGRAERRTSDASGALERILRRMAGTVETMRHRLLDLDHRGAIAFRRSYRRHHPRENLPPTVPDAMFASEGELLRQMFSPLGDLDVEIALAIAQTVKQSLAAPADHGTTRRHAIGPAQPRTSSTRTSTTRGLRRTA
jgi:hypothetical protein